MGWLFMTRTGMGEHATPKAYLDAQFTYERGASAETEFIGLRVLDSACPGNLTWYGAIERYDDAGTRLYVFMASASSNGTRAPKTTSYSDTRIWTKPPDPARLLARREFSIC